jgi:hypothetical protein
VVKTFGKLRLQHGDATIFGGRTKGMNGHHLEAAFLFFFTTPEPPYKAVLSEFFLFDEFFPSFVR